ncbi:phage tail protein [Azospirillum halopraeferens]|uniref:phage tail protein n=1 Tax=Azospirillum halopraeferens TaxID=34010 RepID=UPI0003FA2A5D|nr:tail fiber protein [Azospirillum halopraeferens]
MTSQYVGEIRLFAGNYAPQDWALCNGQLLTIQGNEALFSLIGTIYGGNGTTNFALPDLRGRLPIGVGAANGTVAQGGTSAYSIGQTGGAVTVTLATANLPVHTHTLNASTAAATATSPQGTVLADPSDDFNCYFPYGSTVTNRVMADNALLPAGGNQAHSNVMPTLPLTYIIAVLGLYPDFN